MKRIASSLAFASILCLFTFSLSACQKAPINQPPLGPISATGTLIPAEVSLLRRGTHILMVNGRQTYYVESKTEDLVSIEGQTVHIAGIAEANTSKDDLPVLVLSELTSVNGESGLHVWTIPSLDIRMQTPGRWKATIEKNVANFLLPGESNPILTISISGSGSLPISSSPYYLSGHRAVRIETLNGSGATDVYVQGKSTILFLHFDASNQTSVKRMEDAKLLRSEFDFSLSTLTFLSDNSVAATGSGSAASECGGGGNTLCPQGSFCNILDPDAKTDRCQSIKS